MKVLSVLGKIVAGVALAGIAIFLLAFGGLVYMFKDYKETGVGYDSHPALKNPLYEKYRAHLIDANRDYYRSNNVYYFFAKKTKEGIVGECIDRDLKDNNITDTSGWRFAINMESEYVGKHKIDGDTVNDKFVKNMDKAEALKLKEKSFMRDYEYNQGIDCNGSMDEVFKDYVMNYRNSVSIWEQNGWVSYLFFNYR